MTPAQVEQEARRRYNSASSNFWSQDEIFKLIYDAQRILSLDCDLIEGRSVATSTVAGTQTYSFPTSFISIKRVEYGGLKLEKIDPSIDDLVTNYDADTTTQGTPRFYFVWNETIYLRPIPDSVAVLTIYGYKEPTYLTTASTSLDIPTRFHFGLVDYVAGCMAEKDKQFDMSDRFFAKWEKTVEKARAWSKIAKRKDSFAMVKDEESSPYPVLGFRSL